MKIYVKFADGSEGIREIECNVDKWMDDIFPLSLMIKQIYVLNRVY